MYVFKYIAPWLITYPGFLQSSPLSGSCTAPRPSHGCGSQAAADLHTPNQLFLPVSTRFSKASPSISTLITKADVSALQKLPGLLVSHRIILLDVVGVVEVLCEDNGLQTRGFSQLTKEGLICLGQLVCSRHPPQHCLYFFTFSSCFMKSLLAIVCYHLSPMFPVLPTFNMWGFCLLQM